MNRLKMMVLYAVSARMNAGLLRENGGYAESGKTGTAFYILWFESISPGSEAKEVISTIHRRRQRDVVEWIRQGIEAGTINTTVNVEAVAAQFCSALVGIVYQWLVNPDSMDEIEELHKGLKRTMEILLKPMTR